MFIITNKQIQISRRGTMSYFLNKDGSIPTKQELEDYSNAVNNARRESIQEKANRKNDANVSLLRHKEKEHKKNKNEAPEPRYHYQKTGDQPSYSHVNEKLPYITRDRIWQPTVQSGLIGSRLVQDRNGNHRLDDPIWESDILQARQMGGPNGYSPADIEGLVQKERTLTRRMEKMEHKSEEYDYAYQERNTLRTIIKMAPIAYPPGEDITHRMGAMTLNRLNQRRKETPLPDPNYYRQLTPFDLGAFEREFDPEERRQAFLGLTSAEMKSHTENLDYERGYKKPRSLEISPPKNEQKHALPEPTGNLIPGEKKEMLKDIDRTAIYEENMAIGIDEEGVISPLLGIAPEWVGSVFREGSNKWVRKEESSREAITIKDMEAYDGGSGNLDAKAIWNKLVSTDILYPHPSLKPPCKIVYVIHRDIFADPLQYLKASDIDANDCYKYFEKNRLLPPPMKTPITTLGAQKFTEIMGVPQQKMTIPMHLISNIIQDIFRLKQDLGRQIQNMYAMERYSTPDPVLYDELMTYIEYATHTAYKLGSILLPLEIVPEEPEKEKPLWLTLLEDKVYHEDLTESSEELLDDIDILDIHSYIFDNLTPANAAQSLEEFTGTETERTPFFFITYYRIVSILGWFSNPPKRIPILEEYLSTVRSVKGEYNYPFPKMSAMLPEIKSFYWEKHHDQTIALLENYEGHEELVYYYKSMLEENRKKVLGKAYNKPYEYIHDMEIEVLRVFDEIVRPKNAHMLSEIDSKMGIYSITPPDDDDAYTSEDLEIFWKTRHDLFWTLLVNHVPHGNDPEVIGHFYKVYNYARETIHGQKFYQYDHGQELEVMRLMNEISLVQDREERRQEIEEQYQTMELTKANAKLNLKAIITDFSAGLVILFGNTSDGASQLDMYGNIQLDDGILTMVRYFNDNRFETILFPRVKDTITGHLDIWFKEASDIAETMRQYHMNIDTRSYIVKGKAIKLPIPETMAVTFHDVYNELTRDLSINSSRIHRHAQSTPNGGYVAGLTAANLYRQLAIDLDNLVGVIKDRGIKDDAMTKDLSNMFTLEIQEEDFDFMVDDNIDNITATRDEHLFANAEFTHTYYYILVLLRNALKGDKDIKYPDIPGGTVIFDLAFNSYKFDMVYKLFNGVLGMLKAMEPLPFILRFIMMFLTTVKNQQGLVMNPKSMDQMVDDAKKYVDSSIQSLFLDRG
jgi:hypothetical protein